MKKYTKTEFEIIKNALIEYEKNHYMTNDDIWQEIINNLIDYFKREVKNNVKIN